MDRVHSGCFREQLEIHPTQHCVCVCVCVSVCVRVYVFEDSKLSYVYVCISITSIYLFIYLSIYSISINQSIYQSINLSIYQSINLPIHVSMYLCLVFMYPSRARQIAKDSLPLGLHCTAVTAPQSQIFTKQINTQLCRS